MHGQATGKVKDVKIFRKDPSGVCRTKERSWDAAEELFRVESLYEP